MQQDAAQLPTGSAEGTAQLPGGSPEGTRRHAGASAGAAATGDGQGGQLVGGGGVGASSEGHGGQQAGGAVSGSADAAQALKLPVQVGRSCCEGSGQNCSLAVQSVQHLPTAADS